MTDPAPLTPEDAALAGEYVLRLLPPSSEAAFEARMAEEPALERAVLGWLTDLEALNADFAEIRPRRAVKRNLEARLFGAAPRQSIFARLWLWQGATLAAIAFAAVLGFGLLQPPGTDAPGGFVAEIATEGDALRLLAVYDAASDTLQITRTAGGAPENRSLELWAIAGDAAPVSLGLLSDETTTRARLPDDLPRTGLLLAVSSEPLGGSPTGSPSEVLAIAETVDL